MGFISYEGWEPKHLSFSTLNSWRMCGRMTLFQKVMGLEQHPGLAAIGGNAVHVATEAVDRIIWELGFEGLADSSAQVLDTHSEQPSDSEYGDCPF